MSDTKVPFPNPTLHAGQRLVVSGYARAQVADYGDKRAAERDSFWQSEAGSAAPTQGAEGAAPQAVVGEASEKDDRLFDMTLEGVGRAVKVTFNREQISALVERLRAFGLLTPSPTPTAPQEADALREAAQVAIDVLDHYMHGGSEFRKPAVRAINALSAALAQHQPTTLRETK